MLSYIWFSMMLIAVVTGIANNTFQDVILAVTTSATQAFSFILSLGGIMTFWLGLMRVADDSRLIHNMAKAVTPALKKIFKDIPDDHPALGTISLNIVANALGLGNAATPFGLKAMEQLETINPTPKYASNDMCMLLAINTSSVQIIPTTVILILAEAGSLNPTMIITSSLLATTVSTIVAIFVSFKLSRRF